MDILEGKYDCLESMVVHQTTTPPSDNLTFDYLLHDVYLSTNSVMSFTNSPFGKGFSTTTVL